MAIRLLLFLALVGCIQCKLLSLSCEQIKGFVDNHNYQRQRLVQGQVPGQPAASEMKYMIWDKELADKAEKWASEYRQSHNPDRQVGSGRFTTGENLYWYSTTDHNYKLRVNQATDAWFNEYKDYTYGPISMKDFSGPKQVGHYTQMAWSDTVYVGCAMSQFSIDGWNKYMVVCNYGPAGNILGYTPYKSGNPGGHLTCSIGNCDRPYGSC